MYFLFYPIDILSNVDLEGSAFSDVVDVVDINLDLIGTPSNELDFGFNEIIGESPQRYPFAVRFIGYINFSDKVHVILGKILNC